MFIVTKRLCGLNKQKLVTVATSVYRNPISQQSSMSVGLPILKIVRRSVTYILRKLGSNQ